jgi:hypothetical protein
VRTIIHVNQHNIRHNAKVPAGERKPVLTVKTYKSNTYANKVTVLGPSELIYSPDKPLPCGAKVWIETQSPLVIQ